MLSIIQFLPNLHPILWGGSRISTWKGFPFADGIGESWEVCGLSKSPSVIADGELKGQQLCDVITQHPVEILGSAVAKKYHNQLPLLAKFIDAKQDLSIQVHPNDEMAKREHNSFGKSEMWYVIDAEPGAFLYSGFKKHISPEEYKQRVEDGTITDVLAKHEVHAGDVFYIPAGRVHAIGKGVFLAEIQQSSDITYRIFDYKRKDKNGQERELHTELASQAIDYVVQEEYRTDYSNDAQCANHCIDSPFFSVRIVEADKPIHRNLQKYDSFIISMCLKGSCIIRSKKSGSAIELKEGFSCLIPACEADYDVVPQNGSVRLLDAFIDNKDRSLLRKITRFLHITTK
ncbi:MAG: class I mannose-6-phosphate isomerase [Paludibacteraceae bacterium]|nr:class I mannose-6-phosphate isomerase [Paludibacteraceae bacterium]